MDVLVKKSSVTLNRLKNVYATAKILILSLNVPPLSLYFYPSDKKSSVIHFHCEFINLIKKIYASLSLCISINVINSRIL